jgi:hypothetical protein
VLEAAHRFAERSLVATAIIIIIIIIIIMNRLIQAAQRTRATSKPLRFPGSGDPFAGQDISNLREVDVSPTPPNSTNSMGEQVAARHPGGHPESPSRIEPRLAVQARSEARLQARRP